jgi:hypothetical protein
MFEINMAIICFVLRSWATGTPARPLPLFISFFTHKSPRGRRHSSSICMVANRRRNCWLFAGSLAPKFRGNLLPEPVSKVLQPGQTHLKYTADVQSCFNVEALLHRNVMSRASYKPATASFTSQRLGAPDEPSVVLFSIVDLITGLC